MLGGSALNVVAFIVSQASMNTYARVLFKLDQMPSWALETETHNSSTFFKSNNTSTILL